VLCKGSLKLAPKVRYVQSIQSILAVDSRRPGVGVEDPHLNGALGFGAGRRQKEGESDKDYQERKRPDPGELPQFFHIPALVLLLFICPKQKDHLNKK